MRRIDGLQRAKVALMTQACTAAAAIAAQTLFSPRLFISRPSSDSQFQSSFVTMSTDPDPIFQQKRALRSKVRKDLKGMNPTQRSQEDAAIQDIVLRSSWFKSSKRLCAYISCSALREVDTSKILAEILCNPDKEGHTQIRKKLYVPRVEDKNSHMRMLSISSTDDLIANSMNILEPSPMDSDGNQSEDGLAFDKFGRRLGRGGGYYDLFLRKYQELAMERNWKQPLLVALSYSSQIMDEGVIAVTPNDVSVDALVTPACVIPISPSAVERM